MFLKKLFSKSWGKMLQLKTKQSETMRKAVMRRTELQHRYFRIRSSEKLKLFKWQIIAVVDYTKEKEKYLITLI